MLISDSNTWISTWPDNERGYIQCHSPMMRDERDREWAVISTRGSKEGAPYANRNHYPPRSLRWTHDLPRFTPCFLKKSAPVAQSLFKHARNGRPALPAL